VTVCGPWNNWCGQANKGGQKCGKWNNWCGQGKGMQQGDEQSGSGGKKGKKNQVSEQSCAKLGLKYVGGAGNTCYCPGGYVNKGTGLPAASQRSQCVTPASYNQLQKAPDEGQVNQASCAKLGLKYVGGAGNTCYCPGGYVNKGTGLPAASQHSQCVTPESYNQLKGL
jgi:hypothetical protein